MLSKRKKARLKATDKRTDVKGFLEEFRSENDRASAILGAAYLDEEILELLTEFLVDDEDEVQQLVDSEKPLGAFGARIRAAYCMGLIAKEEFQDLKLIKAIRNEFAHQLHGLSFDEDSVATKCLQLQAHKSAKKNRASSPREMFIHTTMFILMALRIRMVTIENERRAVPKAHFALDAKQ